MQGFAIISSTQKRVHANECDNKNELAYPRGHFACIDCGCDVFVRRGKLRVWHFAHYCALDDKKCPHKNGGETLDHYNAKHFIAQNITKCTFVLEKCFGCWGEKIFVRTINNKRLHACDCVTEVEARIRNTSKIADVALMHPETGRQLAAVEVRHTHEVDADKWVKCMEQGVSVLEVTTREIEHVRSACNAPESVLRFDTTNMQYKLGCKCRMPQEAMTKWFRQIKVWQAYDAYWEDYAAHAQAEEQARKENGQKQSLLEQGREEAQFKLHMLSNNKRANSGSRCKGKCKACNEWMFERCDCATCTIISCYMSEASWDALFDRDDDKYRKQYRKYESDRPAPKSSFSTLLVHEACSMPCPTCNARCLLKHLAVYGLCYKCNKAMHSVKNWLDTGTTTRAIKRHKAE